MSEDYLIGRQILHLRQKRNLTRSQLAERIGVSSDKLYNWETGRTNINAEWLPAIGKALDVSINEILGLSSDIGTSYQNVLNFHDPDRILERYYKLSDESKAFVDSVIEHELYDRTVTLIPMLTESPIRMVELDYYPQAAGMGTGHVVENALPEKINVPAYNIPENTDFVITVTGDSMEPTFYSGDKLYIRSTNHIHKGEIGVFNYQGEQMVKECGDGELISHNKAYEPIKIKDDCYVQGVVLGKV